ncbi:hypothetical protein Lumi_021 [Xylophilus phage Lumi]|nr:hypothetical protein Lumi_021 [Xylophilus phage Lumi]
MDTFNFPFHAVSTKHNSDGSAVKLGRGYTYTSKPTAPSQRLFTLSFQAMQYFGTDGNPNKAIKPQINMAVLDDFYLAHELWSDFIYPHPVYGNVVVKFNKPLEIPEGLPGGNGVTKSFSIELMEQP